MTDLYRTLDTRVTVRYADQGTVNRIRALARRRGCAVHLKPYTRGAYEGYVSIPNHWNRSAAEETAIAAEIRALLNPAFNK